jgi:nitrogen regulatory protein P-II 1
MKKIEAVIPFSRMRDTFDALEQSGVNFTYYDSKGRGQIPTQEVQDDRGTRTFREDFNSNALVMAVVKDSIANEVIDTILRGSSSGLAGEGKIFVYDLEDAIDIGSRRHGDSAI